MRTTRRGRARQRAVSAAIVAGVTLSVLPGCESYQSYCEQQAQALASFDKALDRLRDVPTLDDRLTMAISRAEEARGLAPKPVRSDWQRMVAIGTDLGAVVSEVGSVQLGEKQAVEKVQRVGRAVSHAAERMTVPRKSIAKDAEARCS